MRIMIAEDEPKSREGLLRAIRKFTEHEIAGVAENGMEGYLLAKECEPDLIICDIRMPVLDGLGMLQKIREEGNEVPAILLSGYSDFEYARKALQLQVTEYMVKPLEVSQLLSVLERVEKTMQKQKTAVQMTGDQLLWSYVGGTREERERILPLLEEELGVNENVKSTMFLVSPAAADRETYEHIRDEIRHQLEILVMDENAYQMVRLGEAGGIFVLLVDTARNRNLKALFTNRILKKLQDISACVCSMGSLFGIAGINELMDQLTELKKQTFSFPELTIVDQELIDGTVFENPEYPAALENEMMQCIRKGQDEKVKENAEKFAEIVIDSQGTPECIRDYTVRFLVGMLRVAGEMRGNLNQDTGLQEVMRSIGLCRNKEELRRHFIAMVQQIGLLDREETDEITQNRIVLNAIAYIRENYSSPIGLTDVAQFCNVSPEYLSRIFKEETGIKFVDFLTNFRISVAKRLLTAQNRKVSETAEQVGFSDQKYFQKVFKKVVGVTPAEYKKESSR